VTSPATLSDGTILLDASSTVDADSIRDLQSDLAEWRLRGHPTVHVAGAFGSGTGFDEMDALGRRTVRLNIGTLIVVGADARVMYLAAELEGSWDGESLPVADINSAYDELKRLRGDGVVILVTGSTDGTMPELVERIKESA
jgi:UDP-N-acetylmuramoyl-tripeptide--D-alanyl-D-alanine ligase